MLRGLVFYGVSLGPDLWSPSNRKHVFSLLNFPKERPIRLEVFQTEIPTPCPVLKHFFFFEKSVLKICLTFISETYFIGTSAQTERGIVLLCFNILCKAFKFMKVLVRVQISLAIIYNHRHSRSIFYVPISMGDNKDTNMIKTRFLPHCYFYDFKAKQMSE